MCLNDLTRLAYSMTSGCEDLSGRTPLALAFKPTMAIDLRLNDLPCALLEYRFIASDSSSANTDVTSATKIPICSPHESSGSLDQWRSKAEFQQEGLAVASIVSR